MIAQRRADAIAKGRNGIDFVDVAEDRRTLSVYFFLAAPRETAHKHYRVAGGTRVRNLRIVEVRHAEGDDPQGRDRLKIVVDRPGDYSPYRLEIVGIPDFDPLFSSIEFSFGLAPGMTVDLAGAPSTAPAPVIEPDLNYLAKDFDTLRQLALDRFALNVPAWTEAHIPDISITLVELLAYAGDQLSYYQDAVATEAYLDTARLRISVRRHARLVDYRVLEGCNARACISLETTNADLGPFPAAGVYFTTANATQAFEPVDTGEIRISAARSRMNFYSWGGVVRELAVGATGATLVDSWLPKTGKRRERKLASIKPGDLLILEEVSGPVTGSPDDADPTHRAVVRLTSVHHDVDPLYDIPVVEIAWDVADALQTPFVLEASVARGNIVLVDHGATLATRENLGTVPASGAFGPVLAQPNLTFRATPSLSGPAAEALAQDPRKAVPQIVSLISTIPNRPDMSWTPRYDLLESGSDDAVFMVEMDDQRNAHLRFGDGYLGEAPPAGALFSALYRVGTGTPGNVGAETIDQMVLRSSTLFDAQLTVRNPLPANGGVDPEPIAQVKLLAPGAYQTEMLRAVTVDDYVQLAQAIPGVFAAAATMRWTGNRATVRLAIDPAGTETLSADLRAKVAARLEPARQIGHDLEVVGATYVPLDIVLEVTVDPDYQRDYVEMELLQVFGRGVLPNGKPAMFNWQSLGFGIAIYQSRLIAAAQAVTGVQAVRVLRLARLLDEKHGAPDVLVLGPLEVAQLDNDPSAPQRGIFRLHLLGGV